VHASVQGLQRDKKLAVGTEVGVSDWVTVTQDRINRFAEATGDEQWIHVDVKRARQELPAQTSLMVFLRSHWYQNSFVQ
jgi:acyl dehydratase